MTDSEFTRIMASMLAGIREDTPRDKGNLQGNATNGQPIAHGRYALTVSTRIAPYFHYVNERKEPCKRHGESHYHYFENALDKQIEIIARKAGGYVERG
jgi:hypothetical protein